LQETPDFLTTLVWDNAAIIHPGTAKRLGIEQGQLVRIELDGRSLTAPAYLLPGQARHSIGLAIGHGRPAAGHVGGLLAEGIQPAGVNAHVLQRWDARGFAVGAKLIPLAETYTLATTQDHHAIDTLGLQEIGHRVGQLVREASLEHYQQ